MPRKSLQESIRDAEESKRRAEARLRELKAQERKQARRLETRQKIVAGALFLEEAERNAEWRDWLIDRLKGGRRQDRNAFPQWFDHEPPPKPAAAPAPAAEPDLEPPPDPTPQVFDPTLKPPMPPNLGGTTEPPPGPQLQPYRPDPETEL